MKGYIPELLALAIRAHGIVADDVQDVIMTSSESVDAAVFFKCRLEDLHTGGTGRTVKHDVTSRVFRL